MIKCERCFDYCIARDKIQTVQTLRSCVPTGGLNSLLNFPFLIDDMVTYMRYFLSFGLDLRDIYSQTTKRFTDFCRIKINLRGNFTTI